MSNELLGLKIGKTLARKGFLEYILAVNPSYQVSWFHEVLTSKLQEVWERVKAGQKVRLIIQVPPRHGKSETASVLFPSWVLGQDNRTPIMLLSHTVDLAKDFGGKARDLIGSDTYRFIFPETEVRQDTSAKNKWVTNGGGGFVSAGIGGNIIGRGYKIGIIDDPFRNRQDADSEVVQEQVWSWYQGTFLSRQDGQGAIIIIMQRWNKNDLVGKLLEQDEELRKMGTHPDLMDNWEVMSFPAIADEDEKYRKAGEALWPERHNLRFLEGLRNTMDPYQWSSMYQQRPIMKEGADFRQEWFQRYTADEIKTLPLINYTLVDLAISQKSRADNTVIRTVSKDRNTGKIFLREETAGRLDPLQTIDAIFQHFEKYRSSVWIETVAYQAALQYFLIEEQRRRKVFFSVNEIPRTHAQSKETRIRGLVPIYKAGMIFHTVADAELERELLEFPNGKHDDRADALSFIQMVAVPTNVHRDPGAEQKRKTLKELYGTKNFDRTRSFTKI